MAQHTIRAIPERSAVTHSVSANSSVPFSSAANISAGSSQAASGRVSEMWVGGSVEFTSLPPSTRDSVGTSTTFSFSSTAVSVSSPIPSAVNPLLTVFPLRRILVYVLCSISRPYPVTCSCHLLATLTLVKDRGLPSRDLLLQNSKCWLILSTYIILKSSWLSCVLCRLMA